MRGERKPLKRTGLKPPTAEAVRAWWALPRKPIAQAGRRANRERSAWVAGRRAVVERSGGFCEGPEVLFVHPREKHSAQHVHHVLSRGRGGSHDPENLLHVCWQLHAWIHDCPALSSSLGLLASKLV